MPITKCCIIGCPSITNTNSMIQFPPKHSKEYIYWLRACRESESNIIFKQNAMLCELHFRTKDDIMPSRYTTIDDIKQLNDNVERVNHYVAEWLLLMRKREPNIMLNDSDILQKATEIGRVYQLPYFRVNCEFGWINIFENYLHLRGIDSWRSLSVKFQLLDENESEIKKLNSDGEAQKSIKTFEEALQRVRILYQYCKRTQNKSALEVIQRLNEVLGEWV